MQPSQLLKFLENHHTNEISNNQLQDTTIVTSRRLMATLDDDGELVGRPQEEGVKSTATNFPSERNQGLIDQ